MILKMYPTAVNVRQLIPNIEMLALAMLLSGAEKIRYILNLTSGAVLSIISFLLLSEGVV